MSLAHPGADRFDGIMAALARLRASVRSSSPEYRSCRATGSTAYGSVACCPKGSRSRVPLRAVVPDVGDPWRMTVRPPSGVPLPAIVLAANRLVTEEGTALRSALQDFSSAPQPGCPWERDEKAVSDRTRSEVEGRARLLGVTRHQAVLIYVNAYDHLLTLARALGGDGAMPLLAHAGLSRVVCEAAARFAWLTDPGISSEERIVRGASALCYSADERVKGVRGLPAEIFGQEVLQRMTENCNAECDAIHNLIADAGLTFGYSRDGKTKVRVELASPTVSADLKVNVTKLMAEMLPDSPSWYNIGSSVAHSIYWGLRDVVGSPPGEPLALTPNVLEVGAAVVTAISASGLILDRCARYYGHDPSTYVGRTKGRREEIDVLMRRAVSSTWAYVPAEQ